MARKISPTSTTGSSRVIGQPVGFVGCGPGPASSSTIAATPWAVAASHRGGAARQKSGEGHAKRRCRRRCQAGVRKELPPHFHAVQAGDRMAAGSRRQIENGCDEDCVRRGVRKRCPATIASALLGAGRRRLAHTVAETRRSDRMSFQLPSFEVAALSCEAVLCHACEVLAAIQLLAAPPMITGSFTRTSASAPPASPPIGCFWKDHA